MPKWFLVQGYEVDPSNLPHPDQGLPQPQPPFPGGPRPEHPIMLPGMPGWGQIPGFGGPGGGLPIWPGHPDYPTRPTPAPQPPYPDHEPATVPEPPDRSSAGRNLAGQAAP